MLPRRFLLLALLPIVLVLGGTVGYYVLEPRYSLFDSFYMTVTTLTTVGYGEIYPLSDAGRWFTVGLLLVGVAGFIYTGTEIVRLALSGELQQHYGRQRMARALAQLSNHLIICGYGRMGRFVCQEFSKQGLPFVIIDRRGELLQDFAVVHGIPVTGDATSDEVLKKAGVERARALVTVAASDADNLYITMSARLLNERLFIVARAEAEHAEQKLIRAGANRVVSPYAIGGSKVAHAVLRPAVVDFIELATRTGHLELQIEETQVRPGSPLVGQGLHASRLRQELGVVIVAIKKEKGGMVYTPPAETVLEVGDTLIALGRRAQLDRLDVLAGAGSSPRPE